MTEPSPLINRAIAALAALFGLATLAAGGNALFGGEAARASVGNAVPFVLWFNFLAGFAYLATAFGLLGRQAWAIWLSIAILLATLAVFAAFGLHVWAGGAYEGRTVGAMLLRSLVWAGIAHYAYWHLRRPGLAS